MVYPLLRKGRKARCAYAKMGHMHLRTVGEFGRRGETCEAGEVEQAIAGGQRGKMVMVEHIRHNLRRIHAYETVLRICQAYGITFDGITSRSRYKTVVRARHHAWAIIRNSTAMSYPEIGAVWGGYDHTSIIAGIRKHERRQSS